MVNPDHVNPLAIENFRSYLQVLARMNIDEKLRAKLDSSDLVQETLLEAHKDREKFRGKTFEEMASWLRKILSHNIANAYRFYRADKRNFTRERSLEDSLDNSSHCLEKFIAAEQNTPSKKMMRAERLFKFIELLDTLPDEQQQVILLHHCENLPLTEISKQMGREPPALAALAYRGVKKLRVMMAESGF